MHIPPILNSKPLGVAIDLSNSHFRNIHASIYRFCRRHNIRTRTGALTPDASSTWLRECSGVIASITTQQQLDLARPFEIPIVGVSSRTQFPRITTVVPDDFAAGRLAAEHFLERKFASFGYVPLTGCHFSDLRLKGYQERLSQVGFSVHVEPTIPSDASEEVRRWPSLPWLQSLPKPAAVFCGNDIRAFRLLEVTEKNRIRVPQDVAVIGVDDDIVMVEMSNPTLTSVALNSERQGEESVRVLLSLISGQSPPAGPILIPPIRIVLRQSTELMAVDDDEIHAALSFIRQNLQRPIHVEDVVESLATSRRTLERRFLDVIGRSPAAEIRRMKMERAKELLCDPNLAIPDVARAVGIELARHFSRVFREVTGQTPTEFRRKL